VFTLIRQRIRDMGTIKTLLTGAERHANADGKTEFGAEHIVLSALALPDGTARNALMRVQADPERFGTAIAEQYDDALRSLGLSPHPLLRDAQPVSPRKGPCRVQASAQTLMEALRDIMVQAQKEDASCPLLGAHVLLAASTAQFGVAVRALRAMGVAPAEVGEAARAEVAAYLALRH
jgi:ATP-dependent Clp protease ATP-binding subunit ClpA